MANGGITIHKVGGVAAGIVVGGIVIGIAHLVFSMAMGIHPLEPAKQIARKAGFYVP